MSRGSRTLVVVLAVAVALVIGLMWGVDWGEERRRPNVLIISLDTFRADHMGFLGARLSDGSSPTPALDAFAKECAGMKEAVTPSPLTLPAHVTLLSGLDPHRHGVRENDSFRVPDDRRWKLLAEDLREHYETGAIVSGQPLESRYGLDAGFGSYQDTDPSDDPRDRLRFRERPAKETTQSAIRWLAQAGGERPWFLFVHYFDAHNPYVWHGPHKGVPGPRLPRDRYRSETIHLDEQVGRLLDALPGGGEDTLVIIVADHGEGLGDHQEATHGYTLHQSTMRVPFLLKPPAGVDVSALREEGPPARLVDVYPTVLDVCGIDGEARDGRSLLGVAPDDWFAFGETLYPYYQFGYAHQRFFMDRDRKLITGGAAGPRLYAWRTDRAEATDLAGAEPDVVEALTRRLHAHLKGQAYGAENVAVEPNPAVPYMGGRPLTLPIEPQADDNAKRPSVETRWEVINALDEARAKLRPPKREPHLASSILAAHASELKTNPALLWWTARAFQMQARNRNSDVATRLKYLDEAIGHYARHYAQFKDVRAFDAQLRAMLTKHELQGGGPELLNQVVEKATASIAAGPRGLTYALRGRAHLGLGELEKARDDFKEGVRLEPDSRQRRVIQSDLDAVLKALRQLRRG